jgi:hypothetical protein
MKTLLLQAAVFPAFVSSSVRSAMNSTWFVLVSSSGACREPQNSRAMRLEVRK